jgi:hypothetical protein
MQPVWSGHSCPLEFEADHASSLPRFSYNPLLIPVF